MKDVKVIFLILSTILLLWITTLARAKDFNNLKPFIGIEFARQSHGTSSILGFGSEIIDSWSVKKPFLFSIFTGIKFNEKLGLEVGYEKQKTSKACRAYTYSNRQVISYSTQNARYPYVGIIYDGNINGKTKWQAFLGASVSMMKVFRNTEVTYHYGNDVWNVNFYARKISLTPLLRISVIHNITDKLAMRASFKYRKGFKMTYSVKINQLLSEVQMDSNGVMKIKDTSSIGLGIIYYL